MTTPSTFKRGCKAYKFIIAFILLEILLNILSYFVVYKGFALTPYYRIIFILFTLGYFIFDFFNIKIKTKIKLLITLDDLFVYGWLFFAIFSIFLGFINKNPIVYIVTDFLYVFIGALLFFIFQKRESNQDYSLLKLSKILTIIGFICMVFNLKSPAILLILMLVLAYINLVKKRYISSILLLVPYFVLVLSSNRSQIAILLLMMLVLLLRKTRNFFSNKTVILFGLSAIFLAFCFKLEILHSLLYLFEPNSNIGFRIHQIVVLIKEGIDYSDPFFVSISQRVIEAQFVIEYWTKDLGTFIFGSGSGGVIDGSKFFNDGSVLNSALLGAKKVHNIHLLPFSLIFRYGLIGLMLFFLLLLIVYKSMMAILNENKNEQKIFWNLILVFWFFFSIPAASFLWSMPVFWISLSLKQK